MDDLTSTLNGISDLVNGGYMDIIKLIGLICFGFFVLYFCNDLRQAGKRGRNSRRFYR